MSKLRKIILFFLICTDSSLDYRLVSILDRKQEEKEIRKRIRQYKIKKSIDIILSAIFILFAMLWLAQSIYTIIITQNLFSAMHLWIVGLPMHVTTSLNLTTIYLINYFFFRTFLPGHMRVVRALLFTVIGVVFYDLIWSILSLTINGSGSFLIPLASTAVVAAYILIINRQTQILDLNWKLIVPIVIIYLITLALFVSSGFFQQMALYDQGIGSDPNSWVWLLNKTVTLWMFISLALR